MSGKQQNSLLLIHAYVFSSLDGHIYNMFEVLSTYAFFENDEKKNKFLSFEKRKFLFDI